MERGLEGEVKKLDFEHAIIVKPALLLGNRQDRRLAKQRSASGER